MKNEPPILLNKSVTGLELELELKVKVKLAENYAWFIDIPLKPPYISDKAALLLNYVRHLHKSYEHYH